MESCLFFLSSHTPRHGLMGLTQYLSIVSRREAVHKFYIGVCRMPPKFFFKNKFTWPYKYHVVKLSRCKRRTMSNESNEEDTGYSTVDAENTKKKKTPSATLHTIPKSFPPPPPKYPP